MTDDAAAREAVELLPCCVVEGTPHEHGGHTCPRTYRPAVAAKLRERDEWIAKLEKAGDPYGTLRERITELEAAVAVEVIKVVKLKAANERLRAALLSARNFFGVGSNQWKALDALAGRK